MKKLFFIVIMFFCTAAYAEMYFWIDNSGVKHFSNTQPATSKDYGTLSESHGVSVDVFKQNAAYSESELDHRRAAREANAKNRMMEMNKRSWPVKPEKPKKNIIVINQNNQALIEIDRLNQQVMGLKAVCPNQKFKEE